MNRRTHLAFICRAGLALALAFLVVGCGYQLRGSVALPEGLERIYLQTDPADLEFRRSLRDQIRGAGGQEVASPQAADGILELSKVEVQRDDVTTNNTGVAVEYRVRNSVRYRLLLEGREPIAGTVLVTGRYRSNPADPLATETERDELTARLQAQLGASLFTQLRRRLL
ncbi:MAG: LPS assembly lipoprotein LptE [Gammaproteobacteria bacterium]